MNLKDIAIKMLSGELPPISPDELSEHRMKLCNNCKDFRSGTRTCALCGCFVDLKTRLLQAECPANKW